MLNYTVTDGNIHIDDSHMVSKKDFRPELEKICELYPDNPVVMHRTIAGMSLEWATHNALHSLGILKERTGSVDLNYPQCFLVTGLYCVIGSLVWLFIK